jgi:hypothetical protein
VETLVEDGGDCEDTAILLGKLMHNTGLRCRARAPAAHMALGVREQERSLVPTTPSRPESTSNLETTGLAGRIGMVPESTRDRRPTSTTSRRAPSYPHVERGTDRLNVPSQLSVTNHGAAPLEDCTVKAASTPETS